MIKSAKDLRERICFIDIGKQKRRKSSYFDRNEEVEQKLNFEVWG